MASELGAGTQQLDTAVATGKCSSHQGGKVTAGDRAGTGRSKKQRLSLQPGTPPQQPALQKFVAGLMGPGLAVQKSQVWLSVAVLGAEFQGSLQTAKSANVRGMQMYEMVWDSFITSRDLPRTLNPLQMLSSAWC